MDALVLSGGSIKGAYQAGAIQTVLESGYRPGIITGISVGALNTAFLAAHQGSDQIGAQLTRFWETEVTKPSQFITKRGVLDLLWRVLTKQWDGLVDTQPLVSLVRRILGPHFPRAGGIQVRVGAVDLHTGALVYTGPESPDFIDAVLASAAEPITMPLRKVRGVPHYDGGLRDVAPLKQAISLGATRIVCVLTQPAQVSERTVKEGDLLKLVDRVLGIVTNEIVQNDLETAETINQLLLELPSEVLAHPFFAKKRPIPITVIRPSAEIPVSLDSFTAEDIRRMVEQGRQDARAALAPATASDREL